MEQSAFFDCIGLTNVIISPGVTSIAAQAFQDRYSLTSVAIPGSVTNIGESAFEFCTALASISISNGVTSIGQNAFFNCTNLGSVTIPGSITNWGWNAFEACFNLTNVTMADSLTSLGEGEFYECAKLTHVTLPSSLTSIAESAFSGCTGLPNITIPTNVTTIEGYAFDSCANLVSVEIPANVTNIGEAAFGGETSLMEFTVDAQNPVYTSVNGVLFDKSETSLVQFPAGLGGSYVIPESVTNIGDNAFESCASLTNITISANVASIGIFAFYACSNLVTISVDALNQVYSSVNGVLFDKAQSTLVICPDGVAGTYTVSQGVNSIASLAFYYCIGLTNVTIPATVTSVGESAFQNCSSLISVFFHGNAPTDGGLIFLFDPDPTIYYQADATGWTTSYSGNPTVLWNPQVQINDGNFGVRGNQFGFDITGTADIPIVVAACTNLENPAWVPLQSLTLTNGLFYFSELLQPNTAGRFYCISSP